MYQTKYRPEQNVRRSTSLNDTKITWAKRQLNINCTRYENIQQKQCKTHTYIQVVKTWIRLQEVWVIIYQTATWSSKWHKYMEATETRTTQQQVHTQTWINGTKTHQHDTTKGKPHNENQTWKGVNKNKMQWYMQVQTHKWTRRNAKPSEWTPQFNSN